MMPDWFTNFSWERMFDAIAARSVTPVKIAIIAGKSFLYFHGLTRAAALTYTTFLAVVPLLILLTSITIAVGFGNFVSDYLPHLLNILNLDWPIDPIIAIVKNAEHVPIGKLGFMVPWVFSLPLSSPSAAWHRTLTSFGKTRAVL